MNLDDQKNKPSAGAGILAWLIAILFLIVGLGYLGWTQFSHTFAAEQARLHPILAGNVILSQLLKAAPPWEWHVPLWSITAWALWLFGLLTCGAWSLGKFFPSLASRSYSAQLLIAFALGFVGFGWIEFLFANFGGARFPLIPLFAICGGFALRQGSPLRASARDVFHAAKWNWMNLKPAGRILFFIAVAGVLLLLVPALTPPVQSDGVRYHIGAPQEFIKQGACNYLPLNAYSNMPFLVEMHFMAGLGLGAPESTQLMHMTLALMSALGIYVLTQFLSRQIRCSDEPKNASEVRAAVPVPALLYLSTPMAAILATWPYTDHGIALLLVCAIFCALICLRRQASIRDWVLFGIMLGGLIGTKYTMTPVAVFLFGLTLLLRHPTPPKAQIESTARAPKFSFFKLAAAAALAAIIVGGIWFQMNWLLIGNPVYPFATTIFPGGEWGPANDAFLQARAGAKGFGKTFAALLQLPYNATFHWLKFEAHNPGPSIILTILCALSGVAIYCRKAAAREALLVFSTCLASLAVWFYSYQGNRLLLPTIALGLALLPVQVFKAHRAATRVLTAASALLAIIGFGWAVQWSWVATSLTPPPLPYLLGQQDAKSYRYKSLTYARAFDYLNEHVKPNERVLLVGEHRIFGAEFRAIWSDWFDTPALIWLLRQNKIRSTEELLSYLRQNDIPWIMINERELEPQMQESFKPWFRPEEWQIFQDLRKLNGPEIQVIKLPPGVTIIHIDPKL